MHQRAASPVGVLVATLAALAAVACSSAPDSPGSLGSDVKGTEPPAKAGNDKGASGTGGPTGGGTSKPTTPAAGECSKRADGDACFDCCVDKDPAAFDKNAGKP